MKKIYFICLLALCITGSYKGAAQSTEVTFYTSKGNIVVRLTDTLTPITVDSFLSRVAHKFYDGLTFHRVVAGFVIQGGDPLGTGYGGPGYSTPDEIVPSLTNVTGSLAMANSGPNTDGSQFYFNLVNNSNLNGTYTVFGMTTSGQSVIQAIGVVPVDANSKPLTTVYTDSIRVTGYTASVSTVNKGISASVYPNPSRGMFNIDLPYIATKVEILNMQGQIVYSKEAKGTLHVDLHKQPTGLYIVRAANIYGSSETRLILQ